MVATIKVADFVEGLAEGQHDFANDTLQIALSNTAPSAEASDPTSTGNGILANVGGEIAYTNYSDDMTVDRVLEGVTSNEAGDTFTLDANDIVITASGGDIASFRYIYLFNQSSTTPDDQLILVIDAEETITITSGNSRTIQWNGSGILTLA